MKQIYFLMIAMTLGVMQVNAHDFAVANDDGKTIYYNRSADGNSAIVTFRGSISYSNTYVGNFVIPNSVAYGGRSYKVIAIGESAFKGCTTLTSLTIPESITSIDPGAFSPGFNQLWLGCTSLKEFVVSEQNADYTTIDGILFNKDKTIIVVYPYAKASVYTIPSSVTSIGQTAFQGCRNLINITIPNSVISIGTAAFYTCSGLTSVTIGSNVTSIGTRAFARCGSLKEIHNHNPVPQNIDESVFKDIYSGQVDKKTCKLYVPQGSLEAYKAANVWKDFVNIEEEDVTSIKTIEKQKMAVYPNPATDIVTVSCTTGDKISLFNAQGALLKQQTAQSATEILDIHQYAAGIYFSRVNESAAKIIKR
jgi:hypothetical protein